LQATGGGRGWRIVSAGNWTRRGGDSTPRPPYYYDLLTYLLIETLARDVLMAAAGAARISLIRADALAMRAR